MADSYQPADPPDYQPPPGLKETPTGGPTCAGPQPTDPPDYEPPPGLAETSAAGEPTSAGPQMHDPFQLLTPEQRGQQTAGEQSGASGYAEAANVGASYVLGDLPQHLDAAAAAGHAWLKNTFTGSPGPEPGEAYDQTLRAENAFTEAMWNKYPATSAAGYVSGLIGGSYLTAATAPASIVALAGRAPWVARILWQGLIGGGQNAFIAGAQKTGGSFEERKNAVLDGSVTGGILGLVGGGAGELLSSAATSILGKPISRMQAQAARDVGITPNVPATAQSEAVLGEYRISVLRRKPPN
jgi:hypothetical protein